MTQSLEFLSTFFVAMPRYQHMMFSENNFFIIPYKAVETIVEHETEIEIVLCKNFNSSVDYNKKIYLVEEGEEFKIEFKNETEKDIFLENFKRYKNLAKKDNL